MRNEEQKHCTIPSQCLDCALSLRAHSGAGAVVGRVEALAGKAEQGKIARVVLGCLFFFLLTYRGLILQLNKKLLFLLGEDLVVDARREGTIPAEPA